MAGAIALIVVMILIPVGLLMSGAAASAIVGEFFRRDGVLDLLDGDVYTSEIPWTKPSHRAFGAAAEAVGVSDLARCVYVGDRLFDATADTV